MTITHQHTAPLDWDRFVERCEPAHFEQTSRWALVESEDGWNATYVVARDMARIVAGAMVLVRHQPRVGKVGYILRGPLVSVSGDVKMHG